MTDVPEVDARLARIQRRAFAAGVAATILAAVAAALGAGEFFRAYLAGYLLFLGIALGCLALLLLQTLVGGEWGLVTRRLLESGARTIPMMAVLFVPLLFGIRELYVWARPEAVAGDATLEHKAIYLNVPFFVVRTVVYFSIWITAALLVGSLSDREDLAPSADVTRRMRLLSGPGLVLYCLTVTFAAIDWVMSMEPHWYSTIFGMLFVVGQVLAALAFVTLIAALVGDLPPLAAVLRPSHFLDLGNLLLTFVMLCRYVSFSQFLIVWIANLPEETPWYLARARGPWSLVAIALLVFHFAVPFVVLLSRDAKRRVPVLAGVAALLLVLRFVDLFWMITPSLGVARAQWSSLDLLVPLAIGGVWVGSFARRLRRRPLLPRNDSRLAAALAHAKRS